MSDEVKNAGRKGYCLMFILVGLLLFVILVVSIYQYNGKFLPAG
jgi:CHASE3 domain sensor protein